MINVIIAKPTKLCNADCSYCSSPPDGSGQWGERELEAIFSALKGKVEDGASFIWHGGEPMLMGPDFFWKAREIADKYTPGIRFALQSNLLLYKSSRWKSIFKNLFNSGCSTSYEPDEKQRTIKGDPVRYSRTFFKKLDEVINDGIKPMVIGTFTEQTAPLMHLMYDKSLDRGDMCYNIRLNYCSPVGREASSGLLIQPQTYGRMLIEVYDRWIKDVPEFDVTPLDQMMTTVLGLDGQKCPWTRNCGGTFLGIMPNGDVYNCGDFSDVSPEWRYGNIFDGTYSPHRSVVNLHRRTTTKDIVDKMLASNAATQIKRRAVIQPMDCKSCRHFKECQGGCVRDVVLYDRGIGGKFMYCQSWMMVFDRIKQSILSGEADRLLIDRNIDPSEARQHILSQSAPIDIQQWSESYAQHLS